MTRTRFGIVYAGDCEKTDDKSFFVQHPGFKCWVENAGSERSLHLAILPMFDADKSRRQNVLGKIISQYRPPCNDGVAEPKPDYAVKSSAGPGIPCPRCNSEMRPEQFLEKSTVYRCGSCGSEETRLRS